MAEAEKNMKKLRIALTTGNYNHIADGVSLTLNRLVGYLLERGHEVKIFAPTRDPGRPSFTTEIFIQFAQFLFPNVKNICFPADLAMPRLKHCVCSGPT